MSLLLALLRSPRTPGVFRRHRGSNGSPEVYTEMGVFNRRSVELLELPAPTVVPAPLGNDASASLPSIQIGAPEVDIDNSVHDSPAVDVTWEFVLQYLNPGTSISTSEVTQETFTRLCWTGSILCNLLSSAIPGSLDERAINENYGGLDLTADDALENFQLCYSCAQAQGCDMQSLTVQQLCACEASSLTDLVLEILRVSAAQAIPAADRQVLVGPAPQAPRPAALSSTSHSVFPAAGRATAAPSPAVHGARDCQAQGACRSLRAPVSNDSGTAAGSSAAAAAAAGEALSEHSVQAPAPLRGTAAARRAAAGLEHWVQQLMCPQIPELGPSQGPDPAAAAAAAVPGTFEASLAPPELSPRPPPSGAGGPVFTAAAGPATPGGPASIRRTRSEGSGSTASGTSGPVSPVGAGGCASAGPAGLAQSQGRGAEDVAEGPPHGEPDPLGLEAWERLAAVLSRPADGGAGAEDAGRAASTSQVRKGSAGAGSRGNMQPAGGDAPERWTPLAALRVVVPRAAAADGDDKEARWAAAAQALSAALAAATARGSPLPALCTAHLQCRHAGLRSLLLARALLAYCRQRDGVKAPPVPQHATLASGRDSYSSGCEYQPSIGESCPSLGSSSGGAATPADADPTAAAAAAAAAAVAAAAAAAAKLLPASPAPPLPPLQRTSPASGYVARQRGSLGGRAPVDLLSEHNLLVQQEHHQRELRRQQQQQQQQHRSASGGGAGGSLALVVNLGEGNVALFNGDEDDEGADQEERVLRLWLNSLDPAIHVASLFDSEVTTGWPLLLALEAIQPGCVPWTDAFRPPFKEKLRKLLSVQNCNLVLLVCTRHLAMPPLVNIGGPDLALGQRRATLSLVFQMMRHHMGMLLGLVTPHPPATTPLLLPPPSPRCGLAAAAAAATTTPRNQHPHQLTHSYSYGYGHHLHSYGGAAHDASPLGAQPHPPCFPSPQRGSRAHVEVEKAVLAWANAKLTAAATAAAAAAAAADGGAAAAAPAAVGVVAPALPFTPLASFSDRRLGAGRLLLQLLAAICPRAINRKYVLPGRNEEERGSNARYLLSCARKLGCVIFLAWEDVLAARPNLLLLLMASFMALDNKRIATGAAAAAMTSTLTAAAADGTATGPEAAVMAAAATSSTVLAAMPHGNVAARSLVSSAIAPAAPPQQQL